MAVAGGSMYNTRTVVPPFMSSNMYYGYVPTYRDEGRNQLYEHAEINGSSVLEHCPYDTAMETDDYDCSTTSDCSNDDSTMRKKFQNRLRANDKQERCQQAGPDTDQFRRRNRKRCNSDLTTASELKKFRKEAVVTTACTVIQEVQRTMDMQRCLMSRMHCV